MHLRSRLIAPAIVLAVSLTPGLAMAQDTPTGVGGSFCGENAANINPVTVTPQGQTIEQAKQEGLQEYVKLEGMVLHGEGNLVLVRITPPTTPGPVTASGPSMAVVQLPDQCSISQFPDGTPVMAIGEGMATGIFAAEVFGVQPM